MVPGLQDTHLHFQLSSADLYHNAALYTATTLDELVGCALDVIYLTWLTRAFRQPAPDLRSW